MSLSPLPTDDHVDVALKVRLSPVYTQWFQSIQRVLGPQAQSGPTASRPTANVYVGLDYFDTTLGYKVTTNSATTARPQVVVWVNGSGSVV
jgi:hypothetical protein